MKKIICDFCKKQAESATEYTLPCLCPIEARHKGIVLAQFGYEVNDVKKDVCPECQEKIASLLNLVPNVEYENGNRTTMSLVWDK